MILKLRGRGALREASSGLTVGTEPLRWARWAALQAHESVLVLCVWIALVAGASVGCGSGVGSDERTSQEVATSADHAEADAQGEAGEEGDGEAEESEHGERAIRLSPEQMERSGIQVAPVAAGTIDDGVELLGEVRPNGDQTAHLFPRFPGLVLEVRKTVGDVVRRGDVLALIEGSDSLATYPVKTLIDGVILEKEITRGESVDRDKLCFVVANLETVWVELSVYWKDLPTVRVGQKVRVSVGEGRLVAEAAIGYITPSVDPITRTATARLVVPNTDASWRPGMFATARVLDEAPAQLVIPRSAVQMVEGRSSVFVQSEEGWEARPVQIGREGEQHLEVIAGLSPGERIAVENAFLLKAELGKGEAEDED